MSDTFGKAAKNEMILSPLHSRGEEIAFVSGLLHTAGSIIISGGEMELLLPIENGSLCEKVFMFLEKTYRDMPSYSYASGKFTIAGTCAARVLEDCAILSVNEDGSPHINYGITPALVSKERHATAYLKGAFLGSGSVSVLKGYHLEFALSNATLATDLAELLREKGINANVTERKDKFVSYVKGSDGVSDALALLGAPKAVMELNNRFADRELQRRVNRLKNCDLANIDKSVSAAARHADAIRALKQSGRFESLDEKLKETAEIREDNPEMTLSELASLAGISKSGMKHRLNKLVELSEI